jgi:hypothetical protein
VDGRFTLNGGRGGDAVVVGAAPEWWHAFHDAPFQSGLNAASASFSMGSGDDSLALLDSVFATLDVKMTSGNNKLYFEGKRVAQRTRLQGGRGNDGLTSNLASKNDLFDWSTKNFNYDLPDWQRFCGQCNDASAEASGARARGTKGLNSIGERNLNP